MNYDKNYCRISIAKKIFFKLLYLKIMNNKEKKKARKQNKKKNPEKRLQNCVRMFP